MRVDCYQCKRRVCDSRDIAAVPIGEVAPMLCCTCGMPFCQDCLIDGSLGRGRKVCRECAEFRKRVHAWGK